MKALRTDRGREFMSEDFPSYCNDHGIHKQLTQARTPHQNGVAERRNRSLIEKARSLLFESKVPMFLWTELVNTANYLINRGPTKANGGQTLEHQYSRKKPSVSHLRIIGSLAFVHIPKEERTKFEFKTRKCILVGFDEQSKVYILFDPLSRKILLSKDVVMKLELDTNTFSHQFKKNQRTSNYFLCLS